MRRSQVVFVAVLTALLILPAVAEAKVRTQVLRSGPYQLGGYCTEFVEKSVERPRLSGYVTKMHASLVDGRGRRVNIDSGMLHHVFFNNLDVPRVKGNCNSQPPEVFYGTGEENQSLDLPAGYGYRLRKSDDWEMSGMLMSHRYSEKPVYIRYEVTVDTARRTPVRPLWVRANGCGSSSSYHVRGGGSPGTMDDRVFNWKVPITGRIVAAGGHLHGGSKNLQMRQPACGNRVLYDNKPFYAPADDLLYTIAPRLHEAGPVQTSWFKSRTGIPVTKGETLNLHGLYDAEHARASVMSITHVYVAPTKKAPPAGCSPLPKDAKQSGPKPGLRASAPYQPIPLYKFNRRHWPVELAEPEGRTRRLPDNGTVSLRAFQFSPAKVEIKAGSTIRWRFGDVAEHNITFASGPRAGAGQDGHKGQTTTTQFTTPGRYQFFCYLHPMTMRQQVTVTP